MINLYFKKKPKLSFDFFWFNIKFLILKFFIYILTVRSRNRLSSIKCLLLLNKKIDNYIDFLAIKNECGLHPKHRLTKYSDFFVNRIDRNDFVLDIGCGNGYVTNLISDKCKFVYGLDNDIDKIEFAKNKYNKSNIFFINSNIYNNLPDISINIIVMSNVLEHLQNRVELLIKLYQKYKFKKLLLRVPHYERNWTIPYMQELGLDYRCDSTHYIEHTYNDLLSEISQASMNVNEIIFKWGEMWVEIIPIEN